MPKLHLVPIAALPDPQIEARDVALRIVTDRQWGGLVPPRIVSRKPAADSRYVVGGSDGSRYGWLVSLVSARIFTDIEMTFHWTIDSARYRGACEHRISIRLLPAGEMFDPVWSMDMERTNPGAPGAPVSVFGAEGEGQARGEGRVSLSHRLAIAPVEMQSIA